jgi:quinol monooxygenase YgiN
MIHVIATIQLRSGQRDAFLKEFHRVVPLVLQEQGCLEYVPTMDVKTEIAAQGPVRQDTVVIVEKWETLSHLEAHLVAEHMVAYRLRVKELIENVSIQVLTPSPKTS